MDLDKRAQLAAWQQMPISEAYVRYLFVNALHDTFMAVNYMAMINAEITGIPMSTGPQRRQTPAPRARRSTAHDPYSATLPGGAVEPEQQVRTVAAKPRARTAAEKTACGLAARVGLARLDLTVAAMNDQRPVSLVCYLAGDFDGFHLGLDRRLDRR